MIESLFGDDRGDLAADAADLAVLVDDERLARLGHRLEDGLSVQRAQSAKVDDLDADALVGQRACRLEAVVDHQAIGDYAEVAALEFHVRYADGQRILLFGDLPANEPVSPLVLEKDHRVVASDGGL